MEYKEISKEQIKKIKSLHKKKGRDEYGLFIAEGYKICSEIPNSLYHPQFIVLPGNAEQKSNELAEDIAQKYNIQIFKTQRKVFDSLCDTESPQDILTIIKLQNNKPNLNKSFIALDKVSDPGNVGTIIRTAEWFGFGQIILNEGCSDIYNPKTVRSSMGAVLKVYCLNTDDLKKYIKNNFPKHLILGTFLDGEKYVSEIECRDKIGIIFGNESTGISDELIPIINEKVKIRGSGEIDSLNVSVAAGIVMYELSVKK
ncbi:MAG: RNA methyltransferase [bacterium]